MSILIFILSFSLAFLLSMLITPVIIKIANKLKIVDKPVLKRKIHQRSIPLLGGLAIYLSFIFSLLAMWSFGRLFDIDFSSKYIIVLIISGLILMIGGFIDDKYNIKPKWQIIFSVSATLIIIASGIKITFITNLFGGVLEIPAVIGAIISFVWIMGMIYTTKFLDGLDGLVSGISFIAAIIIFIVSLFWDKPSSSTSIMSLILAGSCLGFLFYNFHPAKIFLGEGGSVFLGFILAVLSIISGSKIATALLIMGIPILDVAWVIYRRLKEGKSIFIGDKKHLHFRLLDKGLSHRQAVIFLYALTALFGFISLLFSTRGKIFALITVLFLMALFAKYLTADKKNI